MTLKVSTETKTVAVARLP